MTSHSQPSRSDQASIKYQWVPLKLASFDHAGVGRQEDISRLSRPHKQCSKESEPKSSDILSTAEFVSVVGHLWDSANRRLSVLHPKDVKQNGSVNQKENILYYSDEERSNTTHSSADRGYFCIDLKSSTGLPDTVRSNSEYISVSQKISLFKSRIRHDGHSFFRRYPHFDDSSVHVDLWKMNGMASMGAPSDLGQTFGWISRNPFLWFKYPGNLSLNKFKKPCEIIISESKSIPVNNLAMESNISDTSLTKSEDSSSLKTTNLVENVGVSFTSPASDYFLRPVVSLGKTDAVSPIRSSMLCSDCIDSLALGSAATEERQYTPKADNVPDSSKKQLKEIHLEDESTSELCSLTSDKTNHVLAKQGHAFAGALAGTFVSLCIHPADTIKTVIQSQSTAQKPIFDIVGSIISERGIMGLYRGIASNITSSAPISAIYTFTYESVKGALLPLLPKEYHSLAHCTAGGCASVATSFIFTPSERIKQQMQISSQYQNCWTALVGILKTGGFSSLYAGWGAVLCRNIPHSIIKFYTYESFKQLILSPTQINAHPTTFQTLVCGGLAGSTAALFSTPFDVVKTRLQTQIPGSHRKYDGVFHALQEITKHEGLKGLYRGLTPRLIMYVSQGALFFASYECFKSFFHVEIPQLLGPTIQNKQHTKDEPTTSVLSSPSESESPSPTMPSLH